MYLSGLATIVPSRTASVCIGDQLELLCSTTTGDFLRWSLNPLLNQHTIQRIGENNQISTFPIGSVNLTFSRISPRDSLPLMSRLSISPASENLNGTLVNCEDLEAQEMSSTVIIIINGKIASSI